MRCPACRAEIPEDATRCPRCDELVSAPAGSDLDDEPGALGAPPRLGCGALVLGAIVLFVVVWLATLPPDALGGIH